MSCFLLFGFLLLLEHTQSFRDAPPENPIGSGLPKVCFLPPETGPCRALFRRYFFNPLTNKCEKFTYGGCQGNGNNFNSLEDCQQRCSCKNIVNCLVDPCQTSNKCKNNEECISNYCGGCNAICRPKTFLPFPKPIPEPKPKLKSCTLSCGKVVSSGWSGKDEGTNCCNTCSCNDGNLICTLAGCLDCPGCGTKPAEKSCRLECGTVVPSGWSGKAEGDNCCNTCRCSDGLLACTKIGCGNNCPDCNGNKPKVCGKNEVWTECGGCDVTCKTLLTPIACTLQCRRKCECIKNYVRDDITGKCIPKNQCTSNIKPECEEGSYYDDILKKCVKKQRKKCKRGKVYDECGAGECADKCVLDPNDIDNDCDVRIQQCIPGCYCTGNKKEFGRGCVTDRVCKRLQNWFRGD